MSSKISQDRLTVDSNPSSMGSYSDIYQGTLDGRRVCIKRVGMRQENSQKVARVRWWRHPFP